MGVQRIDKIANSSMTASSWKPGYYPYAARLYGSIGSGSWCAAAAKKDEYLQVDLGTQYNLVKIGLQGDAASGSGVKRFYIAYSGNGGKWTDYMIHGVAKVGRGGGGWGRRRCSQVKSKLHSRNFNFIHVVFLRLNLLKTNTRSINVF